MISHLSKLSLKTGDVIVVRDEETLRYLSQVKVPGIEGVVPLVFAPQGIQVLSRTDLLNLLEQLEQPSFEPLAPNEATRAPL
jgi:hypothetical protein